MSIKNFLYFISALFALKVIVILIAWLGWGFDVLWNGWEMPMWIAMLGVVVDAFISWQACRLARKA